MLYDFKRWEKPEVKADPFTLQGMIAWLETMPPEMTYNWGCINGGCLIALYGAFHGLSFHEMCEGPPDDSIYSRLTPNAEAAAMPRTFGAALERYRKTLGPQDTRP